MSAINELFDDPVVRAMLWCLACEGEITEQQLRDCGFSASEAQSLIRDESGELRRLRLRVGIANGLTVAKLAALLRARLAEHLERVEKSTDLSALLRTLKGLPAWLFPEWEKGRTDTDFAGLLQMAQLAAVTGGGS